MDEETIYQLLDRILKQPTRLADLESKGFKDWNQAEFQGLLKGLMSAGLILDENGTLKLGDKGRFFWKRVRRKQQGFV